VLEDSELARTIRGQRVRILGAENGADTLDGEQVASLVVPPNLAPGDVDKELRDIVGDPCGTMYAYQWSVLDTIGSPFAMSVCLTPLEVTDSVSETVRVRARSRSR
jgi:hypothetical protein